MLSLTWNSTHITLCEVSSTPFSWTGGLVRVKLQSSNIYEVEGGKPAVDFNEFENYPMCILIPSNIEAGEPEINMIDDKYQYKDKFILNIKLIDLK